MISDGGSFMVERCWGAEKTLDGARMKAESRIAELEGKFDQLTAHDATERQDDKSPNDTQTQTIVYGKESEE
jgi:iron-sulfur cluster repair protein YtfE (RIC family)